MTREELLSQADKHATILEKDFRALAEKVIRDLAAALREEMTGRRTELEASTILHHELSARLSRLYAAEARLASAEAALHELHCTRSFVRRHAIVNTHFARYPEKP